MSIWNGTKVRAREAMESTLQKYEAFIETVDLGSFTRAAESLSYTQSGVSRMIAELEKGWGIQLLVRGRGGVELTGEGRVLLPFVRDVCTKQRNLQMEVDRLSGLTAGIIRIGTFSSVAAQWLPSVIERLQEDYPGIDYELVIGNYAEIREWIASGRVDCGFLPLPTEESFDAISLGSDRLLAVLPPEHPLAKKRVVKLADLANEPFLLDEKGTDTMVADLFRTAGIVPEIRLKTRDDYVIMAMIESGLGVSILPGLILERVPYNLAIRPLDVDAIREIGFAVRNQKSASLAVRTFEQYLEHVRIHSYG